MPSSSSRYTPEAVSLLCRIRTDILARPANYHAGEEFLRTQYSPDRLHDRALSDWNEWKDHPAQQASHLATAARVTEGDCDPVERESRFLEVLRNLSAAPDRDRWTPAACACQAIQVLRDDNGGEHHDAKAQAVLILAVLLWDADADKRHPIFGIFGPWGVTPAGEVESISRWAASYFLHDKVDLRRWMDTVRMAWLTLPRPTVDGNSGPAEPTARHEVGVDATRKAHGAREIQQFILLLNEYIGFVSDHSVHADFNGHFVLEEKINAQAEVLGFTPLFRRDENWRHPSGETISVPHDASEEVWERIERRFGDIEAKGYRCELSLWVSRPHGVGGIWYPDLPLLTFSERERAELIAALREWQRAARTEMVVRPSTPPADPPKALTADVVKPNPVSAEDGHFSPAELATRYGVDAEATRKALERWRQKHGGGDGYTENPDRRPKEPRYLYSLKTVAPVMEALRARAARRRIRRTNTSSERPARER